MRLAEIGGHPHKGILVGPLGEPATVRLRLLAATPTTPQVMNRSTGRVAIRCPTAPDHLTPIPEPRRSRAPSRWAGRP